MPLVKATKISFIWDENIRFVADLNHVDVFYAHPDRNYYSISPLNEWTRAGERLYHHQIDKPTATFLKGYATMVGAAFGAFVGALVGGKYGGVVGALLGGIIGTSFTWIADMYFIDEQGCIWFWVSISLVNGLRAYAQLIAIYSVCNPAIAQNIVNWLIEQYGYVRIGKVTISRYMIAKWDYSDVAYDGIVDIYDATALSAAYGSYPGHPNWNPEADLNYDDIVNYRDGFLLQHDFGKISGIFPMPDGL